MHHGRMLPQASTARLAEMVNLFRTSGWCLGLKRMCSVGVLLLVLAAPAEAAMVGATLDSGDDEEDFPTGTLRFRAATGEVNRVTVSSGRRGIVVFDEASPLHARGACRQAGTHRVRCPYEVDYASAKLGDGDDILVLDVYFEEVTVAAGAGNDLVRSSGGYDALDGGPGDDTLRGGAGDDTVTGGPGSDRLVGGPGDDRLVDGEPDAQAAGDRFEGGDKDEYAPYDTIDYGARTQPLRIDLGRRQLNTEDRVKSVESVIGGHGDDRLLGDRGDNELSGGPGADIIKSRAGDDSAYGGAGNDRIYGGPGDDAPYGDAGRDRLFGGAGSDRLRGRELKGSAHADRLDCGTGDNTADSDRKDTLVRGCQMLTTLAGTVPTLPAIDEDSADFDYGCSVPEIGGCEGTIRLRGPNRQTLGFTRFAVPRESGAVISVPLNTLAVVALQRGTTVEVALNVPAVDRFENPSGYRIFMSDQGR